MYIILGLAIAAGVVFLLMKSGKIEDKNGNNVPDKLEPMVEEVVEAVKKVKKTVKKVTEPAKKTTAKKSAKKVK
jgi:hypothetical protein